MRAEENTGLKWNLFSDALTKKEHRKATFNSFVIHLILKFAFMHFYRSIFYISYRFRKDMDHFVQPYCDLRQS